MTPNDRVLLESMQDQLRRAEQALYSAKTMISDLSDPIIANQGVLDLCERATEQVLWARNILRQLR